MKIIKRPVPVDIEIELNPFKTIMSKTDRKGIITYANDYFMEISEYKEWELMGQPHNVIRHPDMPKVVFKLLWDRLFAGKNIHAIVKNLTKTGKYYWVVTDFKIKYNEFGEIESFYSRRKAIPKKVKNFFEVFYLKLIEIERKTGISGSQAYLNGYLEDIGKTYDAFILDLFELNEKQLNDYMQAQIKDEDLQANDKYYTPELAIKESKRRKKTFLKKIFK